MPVTNIVLGSITCAKQVECMPFDFGQIQLNQLLLRTASAWQEHTLTCLLLIEQLVRFFSLVERPLVGKQTIDVNLAV